jgi:hypothetical protein
MESKNYILETSGQDSFTGEILEFYERSDESDRMDMYMTYRDLREQFERIEANFETPLWRC